MYWLITIINVKKMSLYAMLSSDPNQCRQPRPKNDILVQVSLYLFKKFGLLVQLGMIHAITFEYFVSPVSGQNSHCVFLTRLLQIRNLGVLSFVLNQVDRFDHFICVIHHRFKSGPMTNLILNQVVQFNRFIWVIHPMFKSEPITNLRSIKFCIKPSSLI